MPTQASDSRTDAPSERQQPRDNPTQHIDRMELMKSDRPQSASTSAKDNVGLKGNTDNAVLDFGHNDPLAKFAADDAHGGTRGLKSADKHSKSHDAAPEKPGQKPNSETGDKPGDKPGEKSGDNTKADPYKLLDDPSKADPNKPTVLFLDDFKNEAPGLSNNNKDKSLVISQNTEIAVNKVNGTTENGTKKETETGFTHGDFSARMAEKNGFNAIRAQQTGIDDRNKGLTPFAESLNKVADQVDAGQLKMGKGDVVNVSAGNIDLSFDQVNTLLHSNKDNMVTPENVNKPEVQKDILNRLDANTKNPDENPALKQFSQRLLDTNNAIQRLQDKGIEVIHSGANDGKDTFSLEFMKANKEFASTDPATGKLDSFSPEHSNTTPANGVYPIRFQPGTEMGGGREGKYTVEGTGVTFGGEEFGNLNMQRTVSIADKTATGDEGVKYIYQNDIGREAPPRNNENGYLVAVAAGNSFANVDYLAREHDRLAQLKRAGAQ
jgi:hypothetical protein